MSKTNLSLISVGAMLAFSACSSTNVSSEWDCPRQAGHGCITIEEADQIAVPIYPNPANDHFFIDTRNLQGASKMQIVNAMGEVVVNRNFTNSGLHQVDMSTSAPGVYYIILKNDSIRLTRSVVIK